MNAAASGSASGSSSVPPGFRFHPTDEELLHYYLKKKVSFEKIDLDVIRDVDLNKLEPWELHERCRIGSSPQNEWYFFSHKDKKYPTGSRTNRATAAGFWKATGRDKPIRNGFQRIGMRKTLVFYRGRAPHGLKTNWIMHEYRLDDSHNSLPGHEDGWVVCRVFKKKNQLKGGPQDEADPLSNIENNSSPGDVLSLSEPNTDLPYSSQLNSLQLQQDQDQYQHSMNLNLRQHGETGLHYSGESISHLDCISQNPNALLQSYVHAQPRHFMMNGMKRLFPETTMEEDNASNAKRIHYSHADSFSSTTTTNSINQGQGLGLQMNELRHDSSAVQLNMNAEWSALDKLVASHMMSQGQDISPKEMRYHGDPPSAAAAAVSLLPSADHQLTLPLRNEIDLWNFGK